MEATMTADRPIDERCVADLKNGDHSALASLMDRHGESLMRYLISITGNREQAEDAFQDTWLRVMEKIDSFRTGQPFEPWLFRIARNRAYDLLRSRRRWRFLTGRTKDGEERPLEIPDPADFLDGFIRHDTIRHLFRLLEPAHREMLWLRFQRECSYEEIGRICRLPLGTVKSRLKRALDRIADLYSQLEEQAHER